MQDITNLSTFRTIAFVSLRNYLNEIHLRFSYLTSLTRCDGMLAQPPAYKYILSELCCVRTWLNVWVKMAIPEGLSMI